MVIARGKILEASQGGSVREAGKVTALISWSGSGTEEDDEGMLESAQDTET